MTRRRNTDGRIRELERRVIAGELDAVLLLHQERKRGGQRREFYTTPTFVTSAAGLGELAITPQDERTIFIQFGTEETIGDGERFSRQKHHFRPFVVRGVSYRGFGHFQWHEGEGFTHEGPVVQGRTYREDMMRSIQRTDRMSNNEASPAARSWIIQRLTPAVNAWAASHKREMLEAEAGKASNEIASADDKVEKAIEALAETQKVLADGLLREIAIEEALRRLP